MSAEKTCLEDGNYIHFEDQQFGMQNCKTKLMFVITAQFHYNMNAIIFNFC